MSYHVKMRDYLEDGEREIYLAGGCFWGVEAFFKEIEGIKALTVGYANGSCSQTDYCSLKETGHAETVHVIYDPHVINLTTILAYYFEIIDPTSVNRQGPDVGRQYRSGIFCVDERSAQVAKAVVKKVDEEISGKVVVVVEPLKNYVLAEEFHQDYLDKNPGGYCHVNLKKAQKKLSFDEII